MTLIATEPKEGKKVALGCDLNESEKIINFVDDNQGKLFKILEVGNYSSVLEGVPFKVKHSNIYEIATQECAGCGRNVTDDKMSDCMEMCICNECANGETYIVKSCGLTADYRPNVVIEIDGQNVPLWYHTTFYKADAALEYLKELYRDGIKENEIQEGIWLTLQELQEAKNV